MLMNYMDTITMVIAYAREIVQNIWNALVMTCKEGVEPGAAQATVVPG